MGRGHCVNLEVWAWLKVLFFQSLALSIHYFYFVGVIWMNNVRMSSYGAFDEEYADRLEYRRVERMNNPQAHQFLINNKVLPMYRILILSSLSSTYTNTKFLAQQFMTHNVHEMTVWYRLLEP